MPTITIRNRWTDAVLFSHDATDDRQASGLAMRDALEAATKSGANLRGANLRDANLGGANLGDANLGDANLGGANLRDANLGGANLRDANLGDANLRDANLGDANLGGANLGGANLRDANLGGAKVRDLLLIGERPFLAIGPIGSESRTVFVWLTESGVRIQAGCFFGSRDEFTARLALTHGDNEHAQEYTAALVLIDAHTRLWTPTVAPVAVAA
jgi:PPE-repeat protein